jgi:phospholipid/cholesterol/gamma-HCH transport system substrate-binding protein
VEEEEGPSWRNRLVAIGLLVVAILVVYTLLFGDEEYEVTASFENASQLVGGEVVTVGGVNVGSVKKIELGPSNEALVTFTVEEDYAPLRRGTTATIRSFSLSGIANRMVQLTLPADGKGGSEIPSGGRLELSETVSEVDLDQVFNTLDPETVEDFKHVIQGFERSYDGVGPQANRGFRYLNPFLSTSRRVFGELNLDQRALERLLVDTSQLSGALAARSPDISALIGNADQMMGAIGRQRAALAEGISQFPGFMREANTTFVNLRSTLDDLDPLVDASKPVAVRLRPFFRNLRAAAADAVPTIRDLDRIVLHRGADNDLVDLTRLQVPLRRRAIGTGAPDCGPGAEEPADLQIPADDEYSQGAFGESVCALRNSAGQLSFFRAYAPELVSWFDDFSKSGLLDATGGMARINTTLNVFSFSNPATPSPGELQDIINEVLAPITGEDIVDLPAFTTGHVNRCPGFQEHLPSIDGSHPFTDGGALTDSLAANGGCDPTEVNPGP